MRKQTTLKVTNRNLKETGIDPADSLIQRIYVIRGHRVMLDHDLAELYGVTTKRLNQQFNRNRNRFPQDFAFRLTVAEAKQIQSSRLQNATLKKGQNLKYAPQVFTEHGAIMLASVLKSKVATEASIYVVRAFVKMRAALMEYVDLSRRIDELEADYDHRFRQVFEAIRALIALPDRSPRSIGFITTGRDRRRKERQ